MARFGDDVLPAISSRLSANAGHRIRPDIPPLAKLCMQLGGFLHRALSPYLALGLPPYWRLIHASFVFCQENFQAFIS